MFGFFLLLDRSFNNRFDNRFWLGFRYFVLSFFVDFVLHFGLDFFLSFFVGFVLQFLNYQFYWGFSLILKFRCGILQSNRLVWIGDLH